MFYITIHKHIFTLQHIPKYNYVGININTMYTYVYICAYIISIHMHINYPSSQ